MLDFICFFSQILNQITIPEHKNAVTTAHALLASTLLGLRYMGLSLDAVASQPWESSYRNELFNEVLYDPAVFDNGLAKIFCEIFVEFEVAKISLAVLLLSERSELGIYIISLVKSYHLLKRVHQLISLYYDGQNLTKNFSAFKENFATYKKS